MAVPFLKTLYEGVQSLIQGKRLKFVNPAEESLNTEFIPGRVRGLCDSIAIEVNAVAWA